MELISIRDMLEDMEMGQPFSMKVVKYNKQAVTGGNILEIEEAFLRKKSSINRPKEITDPATREGGQSKAPNHFKNYTRNIRLLKNGGPTNTIVKIHPPLVLEYNGKKVVP